MLDTYYVKDELVNFLEFTPFLLFLLETKILFCKGKMIVNSFSFSFFFKSIIFPANFTDDE